MPFFEVNKYIFLCYTLISKAKEGKGMNSRLRKRLFPVGRFICDRIPTVIILGLIALYYVQLSRMG